jgi:NAD(P)-dependent dehydrogenase (short-subunit alcohol dehydrogenase family)
MNKTDSHISGKTCLITGANSGIGRVTARVIAEMGARLTIVCRSRERGAPALEEIKRASGNPSVELMTCDFSSQNQIRRLAEEFKSKHDRLDILVNNAGLMMNKRVLTEDGLETTFAVNHLGYFLLTNLLLDLIKRSAPARIVNVASLAHRGGYINFDDLQSERGFSSMPVYRQSKLANILFTYELARRLEGTGITVNCLHPGIIATGIARRFPWFIRAALKLFFTGVEQGAETSIYLATSPEVENITGKYFDNKVEAQTSRESYDEETARRLWEVSEQITGLKKEQAKGL